jgi:iron complex transport system substrate-binding protein
MIELAGGVDALARKGADSVRVPFEAVRDWAPEVLIVSPCGGHLDDAAAQARSILDDPQWAQLGAVQQGNVFAVDASSFFARPGPRVFEGIEVLAHVLHPDRVPELVPNASRCVCTPGF